MRTIATLALAALLLSSPAAPARAAEDGAKVLAAFLDLAQKGGPDLRAECRFVGRLLDSVLNAKATVEYKDPGLLRIDLERIGGRIIAVLDLNKGEGFYVVPDAGSAVRFRSKGAPWNLAPGAMRKALEAKLSEDVLKPGTENGLPVLSGERGDGSRVFSLAFTPGYKSVTRYVRYHDNGGVAYFIQFREVTHGPLDAARFALPKGAKVADLPDDATNPFDYLAPAAE